MVLLSQIAYRAKTVLIETEKNACSVRLLRELKTGRTHHAAADSNSKSNTVQKISSRSHTMIPPKEEDRLTALEHLGSSGRPVAQLNVLYILVKLYTHRSGEMVQELRELAAQF